MRRERAGRERLRRFIRERRPETRTSRGDTALATYGSAAPVERLGPALPGQVRKLLTELGDARGHKDLRLAP